MFNIFSRRHANLKKQSTENPKVVMAFGTFDLYHLGHESYLNQAKALGEELIVIIARDETVKNVKGKYPQNDEKTRLKAVKNSGIPTQTVLGNHTNKHQVIEKFRPDIIALGYDQMVFTQTLESTLIKLGLNTEIVRLTPYLPEIYKTSLIKKQLSGS